MRSQGRGPLKRQALELGIPLELVAGSAPDRGLPISVHRKRPGSRGRVLKITPALLVQSSCGISRPLGEPGKLQAYLRDGETTRLRRRLEADAKALYAFYQYGRLHGAADYNRHGGSLLCVLNHRKIPASTAPALGGDRRLLLARRAAAAGTLSAQCQ